MLMHANTKPKRKSILTAVSSVDIEAVFACPAVFPDLSLLIWGPGRTAASGDPVRINMTLSPVLMPGRETIKELKDVLAANGLA